MTTQQTNNILDYLIDPTFRNINILLALPFKSDGYHATIHSVYRHFNAFSRN